MTLYSVVKYANSSAIGLNNDSVTTSNWAIQLKKTINKDPAKQRQEVSLKNSTKKNSSSFFQAKIIQLYTSVYTQILIKQATGQIITLVAIILGPTE